MFVGNVFLVALFILESDCLPPFLLFPLSETSNREQGHFATNGMFPTSHCLLVLCHSEPEVAVTPFVACRSRTGNERDAIFVWCSVCR